MKDLKEYFERIGYAASPRVDFNTLSSLHQLHTYAIPFENLTPYCYQPVLLEESPLEQKLIHEHRGGYCFEQNLLFAQVLKTIGFKVKGLGGRVVWNQPDDNIITRRSHMLLSVEIEGESYLADVGFGGLTLTTPIKFITDVAQCTSHEDFRIVEIEEDFKLQANVAGVWKTLYRFDLNEQHWIDYEVANYYLYTNPSSHFRSMLIAGMPFKEGRYALSNKNFSTYWKDGRIEKVELKSVDEIKNVLRKTFGIRLPEFENLDQRLEQSILIG